MNCTYNSPLAAHIESYLAKRKTFGYNCRVSEFFFRRFDKFCSDNYPNETTLTQEMAYEWCSVMRMRGNKSYANNVCTMRVFARYLNGIGIDAYVLPFGITKKAPKYIPHIYTFEELKKLFQVVDSLKRSGQAQVRHLVIPVMLRTMYCCGLRPVEAARLEKADINLETGTIHIGESKGHRERFVMMSAELTDLCRRYNNKVSGLYPNSKYFFPSCQGKKCYNIKELQPLLNGYLKEANITDCPGNAPRLYDFRHTFASHCIYQWVENGEDINANLLFLSEYMGHACLESTAYYIHLVPDYFAEIDTISLERFSHLLPEVTD